MSLMCDETGEMIMYGTPLYMSTRQGAETYSALCGDVVNRIPKKERRSNPCNTTNGDKGLDIHRGDAGPNFTGSYAWTSMEIKEFLFSIPEETARKYLPNHYAKFSGE